MDRRRREMDLLLGMRVGPYQLVRQLGAGGMGTVYLGEHVEIGSKVAIKVLRRRFVDDAAVLRRFFDEARFVNRIDHSGIVRIFDCDSSPEIGAYLVMEYLEGQTLLERWKEAKGLPPLTLARILDQVASALSAAHAAGIIHRDLKPSNIFLVRDPAVRGGERAKILDFGVAKLMLGDSATVAGQFLGTRAYGSPEQRLDSKAVDQRTDLYALGATAYFLLAGRHPLEDAIPDRSHVADRRPPPLRELRGDVSDELALVIMKAIEQDPDERFPTMTAFQQALRQALLCRGESAGASPATTTDRAASGADDASTVTGPRQHRVEYDSVTLPPTEPPLSAGSFVAMPREPLLAACPVALPPTEPPLPEGSSVAMPTTPRLDERSVAMPTTPRLDEGSSVAMPTTPRLESSVAMRYADDGPEKARLAGRSEARGWIVPLAILLPALLLGVAAVVALSSATDDTPALSTDGSGLMRTTRRSSVPDLRTGLARPDLASSGSSTPTVDQAASTASNVVTAERRKLRGPRREKQAPVLRRDASGGKAAKAAQKAKETAPGKVEQVPPEKAQPVRGTGIDELKPVR